VELVHGPGCPVCVTPLEMIDRAHAIARRPGVIFCSFGDMLRVPGSHADLFQLRAEGADVRVVYSPLDCLKIARAHPERQVVFFAIGFETTAPANAMAVWAARAQGIGNFSLLVSHVLVPPAISAVLSSPRNRVQAFLGPGHVCAITGWSEYEALAERFHVPIVIAGFEPLDLLEGISKAVGQLENGRAEVENQYSRAVLREGNAEALRRVEEVFEVCDRAWRGIGVIPASGYCLRESFRAFDAESLFDVGHICTEEPSVCISGEVLSGLRKPLECPAFGNRCKPESPLGATMVSGEGACAAYYNYGRYAKEPAA
jgi:hydrogenase expression/formation protein HypD